MECKIADDALLSGKELFDSASTENRVVELLLFLYSRYRSLSLKLSDTRIYEP